jgi:formiminotetrahydrofolate cyclodeaminase
MVAALTVDREKYARVQDEMHRIAARAAELRRALTQNIERDAEAYRQVMAALALPRGEGATGKTRRAALQAALRLAAEVPLETARMAARVLKLAGTAVDRGNPNAATDGAVAAMMARTAVMAAVCNVRINLDSIRDPVFCRRAAAEAAGLETEAEKEERRIRQVLANA